MRGERGFGGEGAPVCHLSHNVSLRLIKEHMCINLSEPQNANASVRTHKIHMQLNQSLFLSHRYFFTNGRKNGF